MQKEMININANLISEVQFTEIDGKDSKIKVANFTLFRKVLEKGEKKKEYVNCNVYGEKSEISKDFKQGDFIHVYGYFKEVKRNDREYKNFIVTYFNKIEKKEKLEDAKLETAENIDIKEEK